MVKMPLLWLKHLRINSFRSELNEKQREFLSRADRSAAMLRKAIEELLNLNNDHEYSYTREQLISMMDEEWAILQGEKKRDWGGEE